MKYYHLLICLAFPLLTIGQDSTLKTCKLIRDTDPYTKQRKISTGFIPLEGALFSVDANKQEVDMIFSVKGVDKCFSDMSTAAIYFVGSKVKQTQRNNGTMNCEGLFHFIFRNTATPPVLLRKLSTLKIEKIVFTGNNKTETIVTLTPEQQQVVLDLAACISLETPGLLQ